MLVTLRERIVLLQVGKELPLLKKVAVMLVTLRERMVIMKERIALLRVRKGR